jgi:hypothetical protein
LFAAPDVSGGAGTPAVDDGGAAASELPSLTSRTLRAELKKPMRHLHDAAPYYKLKCPECGGPLALQEGCRKCYACGWAAC